MGKVVGRHRVQRNRQHGWQIGSTLLLLLALAIPSLPAGASGAVKLSDGSFLMISEDTSVIAYRSGNDLVVTDRSTGEGRTLAGMPVAELSGNGEVVLTYAFEEPGIFYAWHWRTDNLVMLEAPVGYQVDGSGFGNQRMSHDGSRIVASISGVAEPAREAAVFDGATGDVILRLPKTSWGTLDVEAGFTSISPDGTTLYGSGLWQTASEYQPECGYASGFAAFAFDLSGRIIDWTNPENPTTCVTDAYDQDLSPIDASNNGRVLLHRYHQGEPGLPQSLYLWDRNTGTVEIAWVDETGTPFEPFVGFGATGFATPDGFISADGLTLLYFHPDLGWYARDFDTDQIKLLSLWDDSYLKWGRLAGNGRWVAGFGTFDEQQLDPFWGMIDWRTYEPSGGISDCSPVSVLGVRGSGEGETGDPDGSPGRIGEAFASSLEAQLRIPLDVRGVRYPAVPVDLQYLAYPTSLQSGVSNLLMDLSTISTACGSGHGIVLVGYSQGAHVVQTALDRIGDAPDGTYPGSDQIIASVLYASPRFDGSDPAARGTYEFGTVGVAGGGTLPDVAPAISLCAGGDIVCDFANASRKFASIHTTSYNAPKSLFYDGVHFAGWAAEEFLGLPTTPANPYGVLTHVKTRWGGIQWVSAAGIHSGGAPSVSFEWDVDSDGHIDYFVSSASGGVTVDLRGKDRARIFTVYVSFTDGSRHAFTGCWSKKC